MSDLPKQISKCKHCQNLMCFEERQSCVRLPLEPPLPKELSELLNGTSKQSAEFRTAIRLYNSVLPFISVTAVDDQQKPT